MDTPRIFDPARHEALCGQPWNEADARAQIERIVQQALADFSPHDLWPAHPLDDPETPQSRHATLYHGAGGVIWALRHLNARAGTAASPQADRAAQGLVERNRAWADLAPSQTPSFLIGDTGLLLLQWHLLGPSAEADEVADRLHTTVLGNLDHPSREALWGNPGTALAALHMAEATGQARWREGFRQAVQRLVDTLEIDPETGTPIWEQDLYGRRVRYLGAGHGLTGSVYLALRGAAMLPPGVVSALLDAGLATLQATALRSPLGLNWHPMSDAARAVGRVPPVQDCHGAPGIVNRLAGAPRSAAWDALLQGAGELIWNAGPLAKGQGLCHGTAGNALALLKLAQRFGSPLWLERGRLLAWHAAAQAVQMQTRHGQARHSLWTGDLGVACVLQAALDGQALLPTLDVF